MLNLTGEVLIASQGASSHKPKGVACLERVVSVSFIFSAHFRCGCGQPKPDGVFNLGADDIGDAERADLI